MNIVQKHKLYKCFLLGCRGGYFKWISNDLKVWYNNY